MRADLQALWQEAFGDSREFIDLFFATAYHPHRCRAITREGRVQAAAYWLDCAYEGGTLAYLYAVATRREARGQGLCHGLLEDIHQTLTDRGYAGAVLVPGEPGLARLYGQLGYEAFGGLEEVTAAPGAPVVLRPLTTQAYARLRRVALPAGGIVQEGPSLEFLAAQGVRFAAGEDFLLAYLLEKEQVFGLELLGNRERLPGIVGSLEKASGRFRVPGSTPFAMFKPLGAVPVPTYLGFAFD